MGCVCRSPNTRLHSMLLCPDPSPPPSWCPGHTQVVPPLGNCLQQPFCSLWHQQRWKWMKLSLAHSCLIVTLFGISLSQKQIAAPKEGCSDRQQRKQSSKSMEETKLRGWQWTENAEGSADGLAHPCIYRLCDAATAYCPLPWCAVGAPS